MTKVIMIDGREIKFKASAATPRVYHKMFGRDIFKDVISLSRALEGKKQESENASDNAAKLQVLDECLNSGVLEVFENLAYTMAKQADTTIPEQEEWLDQFGPLSLFNAMEDLIGLWGANLKAGVRGKKNNVRRIGK